MRKVLIITYYWPPAGGPGVQRVLKFVKYLPQFGWRPIILTVKAGEYPAIDDSLEKDIPNSCIVYRTASIEPNTLYKKFIGVKTDQALPVALLSETNISWKKRFANWIRLNFFIPDAKILWKVFAVKQGKKIIKEHNPDIIFSSSPPPTVHLIAKKLAKWSKIKWVADFRDPWTDIYHYDSISKNIVHEKIDKKLEMSVLNKADCLITVSQNLSVLLNKTKNKVNVIKNGYDPDDFKDMQDLQKYPKFTLTYTGKLNDRQNPLNLWEAIHQLINENEDFKNNFQLLMIGNFSQAILDSLKDDNLRSVLSRKNQLPHHLALESVMRSHAVFFVIPNVKKNKGIVTGKIFEYLASGNDVIGIGPTDGDASKILNETKRGKMFEFDESLKEEVLKLYMKWKNENQVENKKADIQQFSRIEQTRCLTNIFES